MTADGRPYYQNTVTKKTSWLPPEGWVEPGAAAAITEAETTVAAHGSFFKSSGTAVDVKGLGVEAAEETAAAAVAAPTPIGRVAGGKHNKLNITQHTVAWMQQHGRLLSCIFVGESAAVTIFYFYLLSAVERLQPTGHGRAGREEGWLVQ